MLNKLNVLLYPFNLLAVLTFSLVFFPTLLYVILLTVSPPAAQQRQALQMSQLQPRLHGFCQPGGAPVHTHRQARQAVLLRPLSQILHIGTFSHLQLADTGGSCGVEEGQLTWGQKVTGLTPCRAYLSWHP